MVGKLGQEDQFADALVIPLPPRRPCSYPGCMTNLAQANKENLCFRHQQMLRREKVMADFCANERPVSRRPRTRLPQPIAVREMTIKPAAAAAIETSVPAAEPEPVVEEIQKTEEERTPMTQPETEVRECAVMDCTKAVSTHNRSGRCGGHAYLKRGMVMKDGSIPKPHTKLSKQMVEAKQDNAAAGTTMKKRHARTLPAPVVVATAEEIEQKLVEPELLEPPLIKMTIEHVSLKVPVDALDRFLLRMSLEDKTRIVERELLGGL